MIFEEKDIIMYIEGTLDKEKLVLFEEKLNSSKSFREEVKHLKAIWDATDNSFAIDKNWTSLEKRINKREKSKKLIMWLQRSASVLILCILSGALVFWLTPPNTPVHQLSVQNIEVSSAYGLITKITLSDSSKVWLNSGSKLSYPKEFVGDTRTVYLSGEGYFEVESNKAHRFEVVTPQGLHASAYGTHFNVKAYEDDDEEEVVLAEGKIELLKENNNIDLLENQMGVLSKLNPDANFIKLENVVAIEKIAWKDGLIMLRNTPFERVAKILSRRFNVDIILEEDDVLQSYEYSAVFSTETLDEILSLLKKTTPIQISSIEPLKHTDNSYSKRKILITRIK